MPHRLDNGEVDRALTSDAPTSSQPLTPGKAHHRWTTWRLAIFAGIGLASILSLARLLPPGLRWTPQLWRNSDPNARYYLSPSVHSSRRPQVRQYNFEVAEDDRWPDGVQKRVFTINGLFPGPTIELRSSDTLFLTVTNRLTDGTAIHFHGLRHEDGSVSQDGSIGITQCAIPPNGTYTYKFTIADGQHGTFWYHSHHATQRADGLFGAMIVHPSSDKPIVHQEPRFWTRSSGPLSARFFSNAPDEMDYDEDIVMMVGDWYHRTGKEILDWYWSRKSAGLEPVPDIALINGQQIFDCPRSTRKIKCDPSKSTRPTFTLFRDKTYKLRFINTGSLAMAHISIDSHEMIVVEADGTSVEPSRLRELPVAPGQRYAVILRYVGPGKGPAEGESFWLRHRLDQGCFKYPNPALDPEPKGVIVYSKNPSFRPKVLSAEHSALSPVAPTAADPTSSRWIIPDEDTFEPLSLTPVDISARTLPPTTVDPVVIYVNTMKRNSNQLRPFAYINQTTWRPNEREPVMLQARPESTWDHRDPRSWGQNEFVVSTSRNESVVVDIIVNNLEDGPHPFHLHGHHFWPLHVSRTAKYGWGSFNWLTPPVLPTIAPALRDTFMIPLRAHAVFRAKFDTPGMWLFHCHVLVHLQSGMAMTFDVMPDLVSESERRHVEESCRN
ncbi:multicopper oxidase [Calocera viscosa TUFC12733]|uniref:Multicopper oxidase n=1 Tax=Calocera viscosa (strain TUFC12733) TaxID=1330018 RepID=A0A167H702_CALVF|nr:multicopper oxidase [Calocera viscosa TUFC12733]